MNLYHVTYYYLATGMEGHADVSDHGYVSASSSQEACRIVGDRDRPKCRPQDRTWGLSATLLGGAEPERVRPPPPPPPRVYDDSADWSF